ncbi:receptor-type tyrosine-protein phosphatase U-like [Callorhinus ursinus]|uniref:Receptor-type tyrosine-protein phosphatase U-like n=1 Tax=Callorhinus ursinus TaxID=34884 RepID=A0A3Q7MZS6_CALUR|nr:receptor-type tyrosine-protein phosphatase U-like [Callorhinus ursinus]XP_027969717.1 receptor-type tyrosine-protein phosphatase U-like [Eumetopias jubatus]
MRDQRSAGVTEASSLLGGSPRRPCGRKGSPYHTGQLHPAVRVADLLQHINQMKTAEGYGFKQEYEVRGPSPARTPRQGLAGLLHAVDPDPGLTSPLL